MLRFVLFNGIKNILRRLPKMFDVDPVILKERKDVSLLIAKLDYKIISCSSGKNSFRFMIKKGRVNK